MIELRVMRGSRTGALLGQILTEMGVGIGHPGQAIVSYGVGVQSHLPTLNGNAGRLNKLEELQRLTAKGVQIIPLQRGTGGLFFARQLHHTKGRDIKVNSPAGAFFTQYIPKAHEYRVWAYRKRIMAVYEKVRGEMQRGRRIVRNSWRDPNLVWNRRNGYNFIFMNPNETTIPKGVKTLGANAVAALDMDFGAVDIITGTDGQHYVLEVNSAPGVEERRQGITSLAAHIVKWVTLGYPKRNGAE